MIRNLKTIAKKAAEHARKAPHVWTHAVEGAVMIDIAEKSFALAAVVVVFFAVVHLAAALSGGPPPDAL